MDIGLLSDLTTIPAISSHQCYKGTKSMLNDAYYNLTLISI